INQLDQWGDVLRRPMTRHQLLAGGGRIGRCPDQSDNFIDIGNGNGEAYQDVSAIAGLIEEEPSTARNHFVAKIDERLQHFAQIHQLRLAAIERNEVAAEGGLQSREAIKLVENDV